MAMYQPLQQRGDKRWRYTCSNSAGTFAVGYCGGFPDFFTGGVLRQDLAQAAHDKAEPFRACYHTDGHATAEEAVECYRKYMLDQHLTLSHESKDEQRKCAECDGWTQHFALINQSCGILWLCPNHMTRAMVDKHWMR